MGNSLRELAARALASDCKATDLDGVWRHAAVATIAAGRPVDPPAGELRRLAAPSRVWEDLPRWPAEYIDDRVGRLRDTHRLAIIRRDQAWLTELADSWRAAPPELIDELTRLRFLGEIDLAAGGPGWSADEVEILTDERFLIPEAPGDLAWLSLSRSMSDRVARLVSDLDNRMDTAWRDWERSPADGLRQALAYPGAVIRVEQRALLALVRRP
jgi:hypothetical protein